MCGILGEYSFGKSLLDKNKFQKILSKSKNRGPDSTGYYSNNSNLQLGFNRLKILDLSSNGNQPIHSNDNRFVMVYNGEVYNYLEIRNKLKTYGINFKGNGDAEVIINAISIFGLNKTIDMLDGMFSLGVFDKKKKELSLIRDFAGIKPLHYGFNNKGLFFASQYNQLIAHPSFLNSEIKSEVLKIYLSQHYIPSPFGLLENTYQVLPGQIITFDKNGRISKKRYWEFPKYKTPIIYEVNEALNHLEESLMNSVNSELVSDVPIGTFLSGGIDSSLITYFAKKNVGSNLKSVTIGSNSNVHDETEFAKIYANLIGINHISKKMTAKDAIDILEGVSKSITEPFADISIIPTYLVSKISKEYFNVALSGDGGDELFFGYERFWSIAKNINIQNLPYNIKYFLYGLDKLLTDNQTINSACLFPLSSEAHFNLQSRFDLNLMNSLFPELKNIKIPIDKTVYNYENLKNEKELIQFMRYSEFYGMMQKTLTKIDLASMHNSLEVRVPFLKKQFIKDSLMLNPYLNFGPNKGKISNKKVLIKKLLTKVLKKPPIDNIKKGFSIPLTKWLQNDLYDPVSAVLLDKSLCEEFGLNLNRLEMILQKHKQKEFDFKWPIFTIFALFSWRNNLSN